MKVYDFDECLRESDTEEIRSKIIAELKKQFPDALAVERACTFDDKLGVDYVLRFPGLRSIACDVKVRRKDFALRGLADITLEIWSDFDAQKTGWTLDETKFTDYVLFYWVETGRAVKYDARDLRAVFKANLADWEKKYGSELTGTNARKPFRSQVMFVPDRDVAAEIYRHQRSTLRAAQKGLEATQAAG